MLLPTSNLLDRLFVDYSICRYEWMCLAISNIIAAINLLTVAATKHTQCK